MHKQKSFTQQITFWTLGILVVIALLISSSNIDSANIVANTSELALTTFLTAFALYFGVILTEGEFSAAHTIGILTFLAVDLGTFPLMTWAVFFGGAIGAFMLNFRGRIHPIIQHQVRGFRSSVFIVARVTLSFWLAGQIYITLGGQPLGDVSSILNDLAGLLILYCLLYITIYFCIFLLESNNDNISITNLLRNDLARIAVILFLPIPFAIFGADIFTVVGFSARAIFISGVILILLALHALSLSEFRLRKQLNEMRTLSVITRAMRAHLNMDALLKTIYVQVAHLLDINNFTATLYDFTNNQLNYALVMRRSKEESDKVGNVVPATETFIHYVMKHETPLLLSDNIYEQSQVLGLNIPDSSIQSWMGVPLQAGGKLLGVISVTSHNSDRVFNNNDLRLLNIVAASSSIALENAQLYQQQTERAEQLVILNEVSSLLSGTLSPDNVIDAIISSASAISGAHGVSIYLYWDDAKSTLSLVRSAGISDEFAIDPPDPIFPQLDEQQRNLQTAITIENIELDKRTRQMRSTLLKENMHALVELPIAAGSDMLGVLVLYYNSPKTFSGESIELLRTFTTQAAQAIINAKTYTSTDEAFQKSVEQLLSLAEITRILASTIEMTRICELILSHTMSSTGVERGMVILIDERNQEGSIITSEGYSSDELADFVPQDYAIFDSLLESGQVYRSDDIRQEEDFESIASSTRSVLCVPILKGQETTGIIALESDQIGVFSNEDAHFVGQVATQAVIAIENARLFHRIAKDRDRLQVLLDAMEEGIMLINERKEIVLVNPRIDLIRLNHFDLINKRIDDDILCKDDGDIHLKMGFEEKSSLKNLIENMQSTEIFQPSMYMVQGDYGDLYIKRQIIPIRNQEGITAGLLFVFYNKTEEEELAKSREEFSRMIVHDLRSPLTAVTTSLKLLNDLVPKDSDFRPIVNSTTDASRRAIRKLLSRVDALLDVAKMESGQIDLETDLFEFYRIVKNVIDDLIPLADELNVELVSEVAPDTPLLDIDSDKVERVVQNLVDNALKYSPNNSKVIVKTSLSQTQDHYIQVSIIDQGPGIPDDYKHSLFDRYVQIEGRRKVRRGVGLGLTFCKMVVKAHGGEIWIEDNPEGGSIFAFTLPAVNVTRFEDDNEFD